MNVTIRINVHNNKNTCSNSTNTPYSFNYRRTIDATLQLLMASLNKPQGSTSCQLLKPIKENKN
jgi:hypothetical protein